MKKQFLKLAVLSWFIGTGTLFAQSASDGRGDYFVAIPDNNLPMIIATDANQICSAGSFIHAVTGKVTKGTSAAANCLGKQTSVPRTCTRDGNDDCVVPNGRELKAVDASTGSALKAENIRLGITLGGVLGTWPSSNSNARMLESTQGRIALTNLAGYSDINSTETKKEYTLFGADGTPYKFNVSAIGASHFQATTVDTVFSAANTLYKEFTVAGDGNLVSGNIKAGITISGILGNALQRSTWEPVAATPFSVSDRRGTATNPVIIAKANVFLDPATQNKWMLLRDNNTTGAPALQTTSSLAKTMCSNAKVINNGPDMGPWDLANESDLIWAQVTGGTGSNGLFAVEKLFDAAAPAVRVAKNFWISTATTGAEKVAYFPNSLQPPIIGTTTEPAMIVCVQKPAAGNGVSAGTAFTHVTVAPTLPIAFTNAGLDLRAHIYKTTDSSMALAFVFGLSQSGGASEYRFLKTDSAGILNVCEAVKLRLGQINLPDNLKSGTWGPLTTDQMNTHKLGFTQSPFLEQSSTVTYMYYVLGNLFIAFDPNATSGLNYKTFKFSAASAAATEDNSTTTGSIICTGVPIPGGT